MRVAIVGVVFLASLTITGWTAVAWVLTPCFVLAALPLPAFLQTKRFYRRVTRFMCVGTASEATLSVLNEGTELSVLLQTMGVDGSSGSSAWYVDEQ
jgi:hypothetical protein